MSELAPADVLKAWGIEDATLTLFERGLINRHWLVEFAGGSRLARHLR